MVLEVYSFDGWTFDIRARRLAGPGGEQTLDPKASQVLALLLESAPEPITTGEMLNQVWPSAMVGDNVVHRVIGRLRRALGDSARAPVYVITIPRVGYRMAVVPEKATEKTTTDIAILPLKDISSDRGQPWLAEALAEGLRQHLSANPRIRILPRFALQHHDVESLYAKQDYLIEGYVDLQHETVAVGLDVIGSGSPVSSKVFEFPRDGSLEMTRHLCLHIARVVGEAITWKPPVNTAAHGAFMRMLVGRSYGHADDHIMALEEALSLDPEWSVGWLELSFAQLRAAGITRRFNYAESSIVSFKRGSQDPSVRSPRLNAGFWQSVFFEEDLAKAERLAGEFDQRVPIGNYGVLLLISGLYREAESYLTRMLLRNPNSPLILEFLALAKLYLADYEGAWKAARSLCKLVPPNALNASAFLLKVAVRTNHMREFEEMYPTFLQDQSTLPDDSVQGCMRDIVVSSLEFDRAVNRQDIHEALRTAERFASGQMPLAAGVMFLRVGDPRADEFLGSSPVMSDRWWWWDRLLHLTSKQRKDARIVAVDDRLGYTDDWRKRLGELYEDRMSNLLNSERVAK